MQHAQNRQAHVQPHQVGQLQGAHGMVEPSFVSESIVAASATPSWSAKIASLMSGMRHAVDDEPGTVGDDEGLFAHLSGQMQRRIDRAVGRFQPAVRLRPAP